MMNMKIAIIGSGAMGSLFGGLLAGVTETCLYDVNKTHIEAINRNGLIMTQGDKKNIVRVRATTNPAEIGGMDAVIIFVKYPFTRKAMMDAMVSAIGPDTLVLTVQNGIGNVEIIREFVPESQIVYGLSTLTSDMEGPGHIEMTTTKKVPTCIWPLNGEVTDKLRKLCDLMNQAGLNTEITKDVDRQIWQKLMVNASENTLCALLRQNVTSIIDTPSSFEIAKKIIFEVADVAQAKGIDISREEGLEHVIKVTRSVPQHVPSMAIDLKNKRPTEIACLNEAIAAEGKRLGIPTPMTETVARMIKAIESNYEKLVY
jgi:2-dehydropantoate 2-reductase